MRDMTRFLADVPFPPGVEDFYPPAVAGPWITKFTIFIWITVALIILFFLYTYRSPKLVPTKSQWLAESAYGFVREGIAKDLIGHEGVRFAPYLTALFLFVLVNNLWGLVPGVQMSPNSHIAFPAFLAVITYVLFNYVGIRKHGFVNYLKTQLLPPAPWPLYFILVPLEFLSTFIFRPITLSVRLFANMFAGHIILLVFTLGGFALLTVDNVFIKAIAPVSWAFAIAMTLFEVLVALLQAYVFALLTAVYLQTSLADEH
jgi:F-type H+-transporting ATPase subunit a